MATAQKNYCEVVCLVNGQITGTRDNVDLSGARPWSDRDADQWPEATRQLGDGARPVVLDGELLFVWE